jgi:hypothetical protein
VHGFPSDSKSVASFDYEVNARNTGRTVARCVEIRSPRIALLSSLTNAENKEVIDNEQEKFLLGKMTGGPTAVEMKRSSPATLALGQATPIPITFAGQEPRYNFGSVFVGRVDYIDQFSVRHWVKFCFFVEGQNEELEYCKYGNEADKTPEIPPKTEPSCPVAPAP